MFVLHRPCSLAGRCNFAPSSQSLPRCLSRSAPRAPTTKPCASNNNQPEGWFGPNQVISVIDEFLDKSQEDLVTGREVEASLQRYRNESPPFSAWIFDGLLDIVRGNLTKELEWVAALRASRARLQTLPPDTDVFTIVQELTDNTPEVQTLAATFEGPLAVANSLTKVGGAIFFCWLFGLVIPADAYHLWGWSDDPALSTWALWTAPCVGAAVLLVALRQVDGTQAVRPLPQAEERAMSVALVNRLGPTGSALVAGGAALAAGLVFRGAWLDLLTTTVFSPPDVSAVLDPVLDEATMMRNSFGTLLPATPSLPVPPFLLGLGACASVAVVETLHRLFTALLFDTEVEEWEEPKRGQTEVLDDNNEWVSVSLVEASDGSDSTVTLSAAVRTSCVVAEWALCAALCAETLATQSLWMSVATHAACILATAVALKTIGSSDDDDPSEAPVTPEPAAARRDA